MILTAALMARPQRMVERSVMVYRRGWLLLASGLLEPVLYLVSVRIGFGALVGQVTVDGRSIDYALFVAPGLMAAAAMTGAIYDSTANVFYKLKFARLYDAVLATPMRTMDVALGEISWAMIRGALYSTAFLAVMWAMGLVPSAGAVAAIPFSVLLGFAFASVGMAVTAHMRNWSDFEYVPTVQIPLLLYSATFFPAALYGPAEPLVWISPLAHGVALVRMAVLGTWTPWALAHVAVLLALAAVGLVITARRLGRLLLP